MNSTIPPTARWAAWLAFVYAALVLAYATLGQVQTDWVNSRDYISGLVRTIGFIVIGVGLLRRLNFAWWLGMAFSVYLLVGGLFAVGVLAVLRGPDRPVLPQLFVPVAAVSLALLIAIVALLAHPRTRAALRGP